MSRPTQPGSEVRQLHLSDADWDRYVRRVQASPAQPVGEQRYGKRYRKIVQCVVRVVDRGRAQVFVVHSRDISGGGMGFTHDAALPNGADCTVVLETNRGDGHIVPGRVRWSRAVGGGLHVIGIAFERAVDLSEFVDVSDSQSEAYAA